MERFDEAFGSLPDPRAQNARHELSEILVIALAAVLCGAESCADMADFGSSKEPLLRQFLHLAHGIPSHDTFSRVFRLLDPVAFEAAFRQFMGEFAKNLQGVVAIDGKALRGAFERGRRPTLLAIEDRVFRQLVEDRIGLRVVAVIGLARSERRSYQHRRRHQHAPGHARPHRAAPRPHRIREEPRCFAGDAPRALRAVERLRAEHRVRAHFARHHARRLRPDRNVWRASRTSKPARSSVE